MSDPVLLDLSLTSGGLDVCISVDNFWLQPPNFVRNVQAFSKSYINSERAE